MTHGPQSLGKVTFWVGMAIRQDGSLLKAQVVEVRPTGNDMAGLLADAMRRPLTGDPTRPQALRISKREWSQLLPHLEYLGIKVVSTPRLAKWNHAFRDFCGSIVR